jgi:hypothetical protein
MKPVQLTQGMVGIISMITLKPKRLIYSVHVIRVFKNSTSSKVIGTTPNPSHYSRN